MTMLYYHILYVSWCMMVVQMHVVCLTYCMYFPLSFLFHPMCYDRVMAWNSFWWVWCANVRHVLTRLHVSQCRMVQSIKTLKVLRPFDNTGVRSCTGTSTSVHTQPFCSESVPQKWLSTSGCVWELRVGSEIDANCSSRRKRSLLEH